MTRLQPPEKKMLSLDDLKPVKANPDIRPFELLCLAAEIALKCLTSEKATLMKEEPQRQYCSAATKPAGGKYQLPTFSSAVSLMQQRKAAPHDRHTPQRDSNKEESSCGKSNEYSVRTHDSLSMPKGDHDMISKTERLHVGVNIRQNPPEGKAVVVKLSSKRKYNSKEGGGGGGEEEEYKPGKKSKNDGSSNSKGKEKVVYSHGPEPPPGLPQQFLDHIRSINGTSESLVIQKVLTDSDLKRCENRLSMPLRQLRDSMFLSEEEKGILDSYDGKNLKGIDVLVLEPDGGECVLKFKKWNMRKTDGKVSSMYVFIDQWWSASQRNELKAGEVVQVWTFRGAKGELCFALVNLGECCNNRSKGSCSSTTNQGSR